MCGVLALALLGGCGRIDYEPDGGSALPATLDAANEASAECTERHPTALLCSGFEADEGAYWSLDANDGAVELVTGDAHSGDGALRAEVTRGGGTAAAFRRFDPVGSGDLWVRIQLRVPAPDVVDAINVIALEHEGSEVYGVDVNTTSGGRLEVYLTEAGTFPSTVRVEADVWTCVELHVAPSNADGTVELFVDGTRALRETGIDTFPDGAYDRIRVGLDWTARTQSRVSVFIDDVVVDLARIGCD